MAVFQLEPFMMELPGGGAGGVTVDYWKEYLGPAMGAKVEVIGPLPLLRCQVMLEAGLVDTVSQLTRIPEREAKFLYPETPLTSIRSCLIVLPSSPLSASMVPEALYGKTIGFMEAAYIPPPLRDPRIKFELSPNADNRGINLRKLLAGRLDAILDINVTSLMFYLEVNGYSDKVRLIPLDSPPVEVFSIFRKTPDGERLKAAYDAANAKGLASGVFESIAKRYEKKARP
jgi:ABC-type amino acid transport substrate-binding protein